MSHKKDTDYLAISARVRAMENSLLTREDLDRLIEAADDAEAMKLLVQRGYADGLPLDQALAQSRAQVFREMERAVPDPRLVQVFQIKYDYHNAKTVLKAQATAADPERLLLAGGRYDPRKLWTDWRQEGMGGYAQPLVRAMEQARAALAEGGDPQQADLILDRACYQEMADLARELGSAFLQGYVRLCVDVADLRAAVRVSRIGREASFLRQVLLPGGTVSPEAVAAARGEGLAKLFQAGPLAQAAQLGAKVSQPGSGPLTEFERSCDDAVTAYLSAARRVAFGEQPVIGYLYAKEQELTAIRAIFAGRAAGLDGDTIRARLRETYA